jgi:hypothetical protein
MIITGIMLEWGAQNGAEGSGNMKWREAFHPHTKQTVFADLEQHSNQL